MLRMLILGSKEFPVGSSRGFDSLPSGGMERYTQDLAGALAEEGLEPVIVTRKFPGQASSEKKNGILVRRVGWVKGFLFRNPSFNAMSFIEGMKLDFDVVLANGAISTSIALMLRFFKRKPVISRPAGIAWVQPQYNFLVKKILKILESFAYSHADAVVFLSRQETESFRQKMGFLPENYRVIPTGVDLARFKAKKKKGTGRKTVLFLGRLLEVKGAKFLVDAAPGIGARVLIAGDGPEKESLRKTVEEKKIDNVVFAGQVGDVPKLLSQADVFVLPSLSEGLPIAMLEAMAAGVPCVVTDIGLPVEKGKTALVVPPCDFKSLASATNRLLRDEKLAKTLSQNALKKIRAEFSWKQACKGYIGLFKALSRQ